MASMTVTVHANVRLVRAWLWLMTRAAPVLGHERTYRWGVRVAPRLVLMKVGERGRWFFLRAKVGP